MKKNASKTALIENINKLLELRDWSQTTLAEKSGVSQKSISNILKKGQKPTTETIDRIADAFGVVSWHLLISDTGLLNREDASKSYNLLQAIKHLEGRDFDEALRYIELISRDKGDGEPVH